jgi:hypothetical protein
MKAVSISLIIALLLFSCYEDDKFKPSAFEDLIEFSIEGNEADADGVSSIKVMVNLPENFETEDDDKVDFLIGDNSKDTIKSKIVYKVVNGKNSKQAEVSLKSLKQSSIAVRAILNINGSFVSKETTVSFKKAFLEQVEITTSSLVIPVDSSFSEITIVANGKRSSGKVSLGNFIETKVFDSNGIQIGFFKNKQTATDSLGQTTNYFTMGLLDYDGQLRVVAYGTKADGTSIPSDEIFIQAKKSK